MLNPRGDGNVLVQSLLGQVPVESGFATQEIVRVEVAEHQIGVRDRRVRATSAVTGRPWISPGALWPHVQNAASVDLRDTATASAQGLHVDHGHGDFPAGLELFRGEMRDAVVDQGNVRARAAHIKADDLGQAHLLPIERCATHATCWPRQNRLHCQTSGIVQWRHATVGLHNENVTQRCQEGQTLLEMAQILPKHRAHIRIHHGGTEAIEFFNLRQDLVREREVHVRESGANQLGDTLFVAGIEVGEEQTHGQGFYAFLLQRRECLRYRGLVKRRRHLAIPAHALWHAQAQVARHQRLNRGHAQVVAILFHALTHFEQVAKASGGEQANPGAFTFNEGIGGHRGAMDEQFGGR